MDKICQHLRQAHIAIFFFFLLISYEATAQTQQIAITNKSAGLKEIFSQVEKQTELTFIYTRTKGAVNQAVKLNKSNYTISELFQELEMRAGISIRMSGNHVIVKEQASGTLKGRVKNELGEPVPFATLVVTGRMIQTDEKGNFLIATLPEGYHVLTVSYMGYATQKKAFELKANQTAFQEIILLLDNKALNEVIVKGKTEVQKFQERGYHANMLDASKFNNSTRDLNQLLNVTSGIRIREQGGLGSNFNFSLNGLSGKAVRFFIDGIPMENYGVGMAFNNIPVNLASKLEVYKGVVPVELGADALGGAVNMVTGKGTGNYIDASYSAGSFNTHRGALSSQYRNDSTGFIMKLSGFYNYSDNNYMMYSNPKYDASILMPDGSGGFEERNVKRFHDRYRSAMVQGELGYINKSWADVFMVGFLYNNHYKQYQTGATQDVVYGKIDRRGDYIMPSLRYKKSNLLLNGLDASAFLSYGIDNYAVTDTSRSTFWWDGSPSSTNNNHGEFAANIPTTITHFRNAFLLSRLNLAYQVNDLNSITLNYNFSNANRKSNEELGAKSYAEAGQSKSVLGMAWKNVAFKGRLNTTAFAKLFHFNLSIAETIDARNPMAAQHKNYDDFGYGLASRYAINEHVGIRASYEHAYRLPEQVEVLGDGVNIIANLNIRPESSHNLNLGLDVSATHEQHYYRFDLSAFYRNATDFIYSIPSGSYSSQYLNEGKVRILGGEAEAQYKFSDLVELTLNASYQRSEQTQEYIYGTQTRYATYGNMIPNQPWLFGNLFFSLGKNDWLGKDTRIQFDWSTQYLHSFFLTWEAWGSAQSRNVIPSQLLHNAGITYSLKQKKYNISIESRNLGDVLAYDNFRQQKPGRSFNLKFRYFIH